LHGRAEYAAAAEKHKKESSVKQALLRAQWMLLAFAPIAIHFLTPLGKRWF
jgi:hypothetical protein